MIKVLFLAANPSDTVRLRIDEEMRAIDAAIRQGAYCDQFDLRNHGAVRIDDLQELLLRHQPDIVHFSGHGSDASEIILQNAAGDAVFVGPDALSNLFRLLKDNIRCVVLNACYSEEQAAGIAENIDCVVGMSDAITDEAAIDFATAFYRGLGYGRSIHTAFELGCSQIDLSNLGEQDIPTLKALQRDPDELYLVGPQHRAVGANARLNMAPNAPSDFVDRSREYNALKKHLLANGKDPVAITAALLGAGGYGKTTLAQALCHDPEIAAAHSDGILWTVLGENPGDVTGRLLGLAAKLEPNRPRPGAQEGIDAARATLVEALGEKQVLLVIDDVWREADLAPFLAGGPNCTYLVTTRNVNTLPRGLGPGSTQILSLSSAIYAHVATKEPLWSCQDQLRLRQDICCRVR